MPIEAVWWVTYANDYPGLNGPMHAYLANADCGYTQIRNTVISSHDASGCLIDHESRISDIEIPENLKLELEVLHWKDRKLNP